MNFIQFLMIYSKNLQMRNEDMVLEKAIISKFYHMAAKLKLLNHDSFSITITITFDLYNFDRYLNAHVLK